jgi:hypothetical protein
MNISYPDQNFRVFQSYSTCGYVFGINLQPEYPTKDQIEMNRNYLIAASLFLAFNLQAQEYNFSRSTRNYTQLSTTNRFPLDSFSSLDTMFKTSFRIDYFKRLMGDSVLFDGSLLYLTEAGLPSTLNDEISPMEADIRPRSNGTAYIAHTTEGNAGNRIFKIEYHNMGFNDDTTHNDSASYQIWFYENGVIEFLYGPSSVRNSASWYDGETGPAVYMGSWDTINETVIGLSGNPNNPTLYDKWPPPTRFTLSPLPLPAMCTNRQLNSSTLPIRATRHSASLAHKGKPIGLCMMHSAEPFKKAVAAHSYLSSAAVFTASQCKTTRAAKCMALLCIEESSKRA